MSIVARPADSGSVRAHQQAVAAALTGLLAYELPPVNWSLFAHIAACKGQLSPMGRGDEQLAAYLAQWAEVIDGRFYRFPSTNEDIAYWHVRGRFDGVEVDVWTIVSAGYDAAHTLPSAPTADGLEEQAEEVYLEEMLQAAHKLQQLGTPGADVVLDQMAGGRR